MRSGISTGQPLASTVAPTVVRPEIAYYASAAGGRTAFNIATGFVTVTRGTAEQPLAALVNPADSGKDMFLHFGEFGSSIDTRFRRYRGATVTGLANPISPVNMAGTTGNPPTSAARMYVPPGFTKNGGVVAKTAYIAAYRQYRGDFEGASIVRPGGVITWTIDQVDVPSASASIYLEYFERPAT